MTKQIHTIAAHLAGAVAVLTILAYPIWGWGVFCAGVPVLAGASVAALVSCAAWAIAAWRARDEDARATALAGCFVWLLLAAVNVGGVLHPSDQLAAACAE